MDELKLLYPEGIKIKIGDKEKTIMPLVFGQRLLLTRTIAGILVDLGKKFPNMKTQGAKIEDMIDPFVSIAGERMLEIYEVALMEDPEWIKAKLTLQQEFRLVRAIFEVNDIPFLISEFRAIKEKIQQVRNSVKS